MPAAVTQDPRFQAVQEFLKLGLRDRAIDVALDLSRILASDGIAQY